VSKATRAQRGARVSANQRRDPSPGSRLASELCTRRHKCGRPIQGALMPRSRLRSRGDSSTARHRRALFGRRNDECCFSAADVGVPRRRRVPHRRGTITEPAGALKVLRLAGGNPNAPRLTLCHRPARFCLETFNVRLGLHTGPTSGSPHHRATHAGGRKRSPTDPAATLKK
jgi:hypothetical protein